jgi:lipoate---protein ligase
MIRRMTRFREVSGSSAWTVDLGLLDLTLPTVEENLALDEALLVAADERGGRAVLRFWEQSGFAVVLGASRRIAADVRIDPCREDGVPVVRRASGGGTVVIGPGALNVTLVLPMAANPALATVDGAQSSVLERIASGLRSGGAAVDVRGSGDLTIDGRKFAGSAQRRLRTTVLVHASILYDLPIRWIDRYLQLPERQPAYRGGRSHEDFLMNLSISRTILTDLIRSTWSPSSLLSAASDVPQDLLESLLVEKFANRSWIERL